MPRFKKLFDSDDQAKWISNRLNNGDFDYWMVIDAKYLPEWAGEAEARQMGGNHLVDLSVVSPSEAGKKNLEAAAESQGRETKGLSDEEKAEMLADYGVAATMWHDTGNNLRNLLKKAKEEAQKVEGLFGFYMDRQLNRMGNTGWDFIKGEIGP